MKTTRKFYSFTSLAAFHDAVHRLDDTHGPGFLGCTRDEADARRYSYPEAVAALAALPELSTPITSGQFAKTWTDYDGDDMDVERYQDGRPFLSRRIRETGRRARHVQTILVNITEGAAVKARDMLWKAYAAARLVDQLESTGTRCEVFAVCHARGTFTNGNDYAAQIMLKGPDEPLDLAALAAAFTPWTLRRFVFGHMDTVGRCKPGKGYALTWPQELIPPGAIVIETGDCLTRTSAADMIRTTTANHQSALAA